MPAHQAGREAGWSPARRRCTTIRRSTTDHFTERAVVAPAESPGPRAAHLLPGHRASQSALKAQCPWHRWAQCPWHRCRRNHERQSCGPSRRARDAGGTGRSRLAACGAVVCHRNVRGDLLPDLREGLHGSSDRKPRAARDRCRWHPRARWPEPGHGRHLPRRVRRRCRAGGADPEGIRRRSGDGTQCLPGVAAPGVDRARHRVHPAGSASSLCGSRPLRPPVSPTS